MRTWRDSGRNEVEAARAVPDPDEAAADPPGRDGCLVRTEADPVRHMGSGSGWASSPFWQEDGILYVDSRLLVATPLLPAAVARSAAEAERSGVSPTRARAVGVPKPRVARDRPARTENAPSNKRR